LIRLTSSENDFELRFMCCHVCADYGSFLAAANVIFVDSPVGVGFSYSTVGSDYSNFTASQIALDAYQFLVNWSKSYPGYNNNELYIIGESYGGHYLPNLVQQVVNQNKDPGAYQLKNLKGFQVSNFTTQRQVLDNFMFLLWGGRLAVLSSGVPKLGFHKFVEMVQKGAG
jgi:hypothetical protein